MEPELAERTVTTVGAGACAHVGVRADGFYVLCVMYRSCATLCVCVCCHMDARDAHAIDAGVRIVCSL